jgi:serine/threonine protein kinase
MSAVPEPFEPLRPQDPPSVSGYRLRARLGAGGMGRVHLSFSPGGRPVAIKVIREELASDAEFRARFAHEAQAAQRVNGIHIAQLLDADADAETPWLATAYVPGPSLSEAVRLAGPLPAELVRELAAAVADALRAIHAADIIHRDLKPGNVVIGPDGPRVIDFGVARAADATPLSLSGVRIGTPQYTAPEQIRGQSVTPAADVFALGGLAFYAATGRPAFGEGDEFSVVYRVANEEPDLTGCPEELEQIIRSCLAKEPGDRPTPEELIEAWRPGGGPFSVASLPEPVQQAIRTREAAVAALSAPSTTPPPPPAAGTGPQGPMAVPVGVFPPGPATPPPGGFPHNPATPPPGGFPQNPGTPPPGGFPHNPATPPPGGFPQNPGTPPPGGFPQNPGTPPPGGFAQNPGTPPPGGFPQNPGTPPPGGFGPGATTPPPGAFATGSAAPSAGPAPPGAAVPPGPVPPGPVAGGMPSYTANGPSGPTGPYGGPPGQTGPLGTTGQPVGVQQPPAPRRKRWRYRFTLYGVSLLLAAGLGAFLVTGLPEMLREDPARNTNTLPSGTPSPPATQPGAQQGGQADTTAPSFSPSPTPTTATEQWKGQIRFGENGIDLDPAPPRTAGDGGGSQVIDMRDTPYDSDPEILAVSIAPWRGSAPPTYQQCAEAASAQGADRSPGPARTGQWYCVRTGEGRIVSMKIDAAVEGYEGATIRATATVWAPPGVEGGTASPTPP